MNLKEEEKGEIAKLKDDIFKSVDSPHAQALALISIAESLIVIKNKIGRKLP